MLSVPRLALSVLNQAVNSNTPEASGVYFEDDEPKEIDMDDSIAITPIVIGGRAVVINPLCDLVVRAISILRRLLTNKYAHKRNQSK